MIKNIIFDLGDVFVNLDKEGAIQNAKELFRLPELTEEMWQINNSYEKGAITTEDFLSYYLTTFPFVSKEAVLDCWSYIIKDFPKHRLAFIQSLSKTHRCFLLSNTNELHISYMKATWGVSFYKDFEACFEKFYLSHEIKMRKPDKAIYEFVLSENNLKPEQTLFVDDLKENTDSASTLGIHVWNINPNAEDVVNLLNVKKKLF